MIHSRDGLPAQAVRAIQVLFNFPIDLAVVEFKPKGMDWPALQSFSRNLILGSANAHVCSLVYKFPVYFWLRMSHTKRRSRRVEFVRSCVGGMRRSGGRASAIRENNLPSR